MEGDPRIPVMTEIDRVLDKFSALDKHTSNALEDLIEKLHDLENQLEGELILCVNLEISYPCNLLRGF